MRFLANRDEHLHFALLTDFRDAREAENCPRTPRSLDSSRARASRQLNAAYAERRRRMFLPAPPAAALESAASDVWMGIRAQARQARRPERAAARRRRDRFLARSSAMSTDCARRATSSRSTPTRSCRATPRASWSATMAHPLNRPRFDAKRGRVVAGYGILQPRVGVSLPRHRTLALRAPVRRRAGHRSVHARRLRRLPGSVRRRLVHRQGHLRRRRVRAVLDERFPENRILSHDLLEGCYARSGLVSDVELYEDYPSRYRPTSSRRHRWIRGDWQIAAWLLPRVPARRWRARAQSAVGAVALEDLRQPAPQPGAARRCSACSLLGWIAAGVAGWRWTPVVRRWHPAPPVLSTRCRDAARTQAQPDLPRHVCAHCRCALRSALRSRCSRSPACRTRPASSLDAIVRTLCACSSPQRHLLEWTTVAASRRAERTRPTWPAACRVDVVRPGGRRSACGSYLALDRACRAAVPRPLLLLWLLAPLAALVAQPADAASRSRWLPQHSAVPAQRRAAHLGVLRDASSAPRTTGCRRTISRSTRRDVAHRTSPTNIGLCLLANLAAYDFGYLGLAQLLERSATTFDTLERLERHRGHFYNWYDTRTLQPLPPALRLDRRQRQPRRAPADAARGLAASWPTRRWSTRRLFAGLARHAVDLLRQRTGRRTTRRRCAICVPRSPTSSASRSHRACRRYAAICTR